MKPIHAKVFKSGNSKALRLPSALRIKSRALLVTPANGGFLLTDPADAARRRRALRKLWGSAPDFPDTR